MCFSEEQLDSYLEDNTDGKLRKEIDQHLETCKTCRGELEERAAFKALMIQKPEKSMGPHLILKDIDEFLSNKVSKEQEAKIIDHLIHCEECHKDFEIRKIEENLIQEEEASNVETPANLPPKLSAFFMKYVIKESVSEVIRKRFPDKNEFLNKFWDQLLELSEIFLPGKPNLVGALGFSDLKPDAPEYQILGMIKTLNDSARQINENDDSEKVAGKIRASAKQNRLKKHLMNDLIESTKPYF